MNIVTSRKFSFGMERVEEFFVDCIQSGSQLLIESMTGLGFGDECMRIKSLEDYWKCGDEFLNQLSDHVIEFLSENGVHIDYMDVWFDGGDESLFEGGQYCWKYFEFDGWFWYMSPEGDVSGLHKDGAAVSL